MLFSDFNLAFTQAKINNHHKDKKRNFVVKKKKSSFDRFVCLFNILKRLEFSFGGHDGNEMTAKRQIIEITEMNKSKLKQQIGIADFSHEVLILWANVCFPTVCSVTQPVMEKSTFSRNMMKR